MNRMMLDRLLKDALMEDIGHGDITSEAIFDAEHGSTAVLVAKQNIVLAGMEVFCRVFALIDERVEVKALLNDGECALSGARLASITGPTRSILAGERVALNFIQRMSGIATMTRAFTEAVGENKTVITDTRKTAPGLRALDKYAVAAGGGRNHRFGLHSMVLIKDNHIRAAGGITPAVHKVRRVVSPFVRIEVETETMAEVQEALIAGVDVIMLDNMPISMVREAITLIDRRALVEVSGNVTLERIAELAEAGADIISSGALTHSVLAADLSLKFE